MDIIKIGKVTSPVGLKGEVKIISYSDEQDRFEMLQTVFCDERKYLKVIGSAGSSHNFINPSHNFGKPSHNSGNPSHNSGNTSHNSGNPNVPADTADTADVTGYVRLTIESIRYKGSGIILKLEGIDDRNASEKARGMELFMDADELPELEEGQFYVRDIVGFEVCTEDGEVLGTLKDVLTNTAQDIYVVKRERDLMIPGVPEFIRCVDQENRRITVVLPEGLLEL